MSARSARRAAAALALIAPTVWSGTDGTLGPTSTARMDITMQLLAPRAATEVGLSGLKDIALPTLQADGSSGEARSEVCLYHTTPSFSVRVSQPDSATGTPLALAGPDGRTLPLRIGFESPGGAGTDLPDSGVLTGLQGNRSSPTCAEGGRNVLYARSLGGDDVEAGVYEGVIVLLIAPE